jgi:hypothetical protein
MRECFGHGPVGRDFPETEFVSDGVQYIHVRSQPPLHNSAGERVYQDAQGHYHRRPVELPDLVVDPDVLTDDDGSAKP